MNMAMNLDPISGAAYFFGGLLLANSIPHIVSGTLGRPFPTPFGRPPGAGLSSSTVNVAWGFSNLVAGYLLISEVGAFDVQNIPDMAVLALGALLVSLFSARHFGQFNGGNLP